MAQKALPSTKQKRLGRGRPRKDADDQLVIDMADALAKVYGLRPQASRDLALALKEGHAREITPKERAKLPRRFQRQGWILLRHELPITATYKGREGAIAAKLKRGKIKPRPDVVQALTRLLRMLATKETAAVLGTFQGLKLLK
jgi:hypothetical protein